MINIDVALKVFTLGVRRGTELTKMGVDVLSMHGDEAAEILYDVLKTHLIELEKLAKELTTYKERELFYAQYASAKTFYQWGLEHGFRECEIQMETYKGVANLTEEKIEYHVERMFRDKNKILEES